MTMKEMVGGWPTEIGTGGRKPTGESVEMYERFSTEGNPIRFSVPDEGRQAFTMRCRRVAMKLGKQASVHYTPDGVEVWLNG